MGEWSRSVLENNPNVDGVIIYNSKEFARHPYTAHRFSDLKRKLGSWKPDLIIGLRDDWRTITGGFFSGARRINRGRVHMKEWIERKRSDRSHSSHEVIRLWDVLAPLGVEPVEVDHLHYTVTDQERERAAEFMMAHGIEPPFAVIHAGTSEPVKEWSLERFAASARHIAGGYGMRIVLIGAPEEVDRSADLALMIPELDPIDITGKLSLRATAAVLEERKARRFMEALREVAILAQRKPSQAIGEWKNPARALG